MAEASPWGILQDESCMLYPLSRISLIWGQPELLDLLSSVEGKFYLERYVFTFCSPSLLGDALYLFAMIMLNGCGANVKPYLPVMLGFFESLGKENVKLCIRLTNIRNNSIFASCSPIHTRFPKNEMRKKVSMIIPHSLPCLKKDTFIWNIYTECFKGR